MSVPHQRWLVSSTGSSPRCPRRPHLSMSVPNSMRTVRWTFSVHSQPHWPAISRHTMLRAGSASAISHPATHAHNKRTHNTRTSTHRHPFLNYFVGPHWVSFWSKDIMTWGMNIFMTILYIIIIINIKRVIQS